VNETHAQKPHIKNAMAHTAAASADAMQEQSGSGTHMAHP
jgi:hypothetical protein